MSMESSNGTSIIPIEEVERARKLMMKSLASVFLIGIPGCAVGLYLALFYRPASHPYGIYFGGIGLGEWVLIGTLALMILSVVFASIRVSRILQKSYLIPLAIVLPLISIFIVQFEVFRAMNKAGYKLKWGKLVPLEEKK